MDRVSCGNAESSSAPDPYPATRKTCFADGIRRALPLQLQRKGGILVAGNHPPQSRAAGVSVGDEALVFWVDEFNRASDEDWREFAEARKKKSEKLTALKERLGSYYDIAASTGLTDDLSQKIRQTVAVIDQLNAQDAMKKPELIDAEEVKLIRNQLAEVFASGDKDAKRLILKQFVVEITADAENREIARGFVQFVAAPRGSVPAEQFLQFHPH